MFVYKSLESIGFLKDSLMHSRNNFIIGDHQLQDSEEVNFLELG